MCLNKAVPFGPGNSSLFTLAQMSWILGEMLSPKYTGLKLVKFWCGVVLWERASHSCTRPARLGISFSPMLGSCPAVSKRFSASPSTSIWPFFVAAWVTGSVDDVFSRFHICTEIGLEFTSVLAPALSSKLAKAFRSSDVSALVWHGRYDRCWGASCQTCIWACVAHFASFCVSSPCSNCLAILKQVPLIDFHASVGLSCFWKCSSFASLNLLVHFLHRRCFASWTAALLLRTGVQARIALTLSSSHWRA